MPSKARFCARCIEQTRAGPDLLKGLLQLRACREPVPVLVSEEYTLKG